MNFLYKFKISREVCVNTKFQSFPLFLKKTWYINKEDGTELQQKFVGLFSWYLCFYRVKINLLAYGVDRKRLTQSGADAKNKTVLQLFFRY